MRVFERKERKDRSIAIRLTVSLMISVSMVSIITFGAFYYRELQKNKKELEQKADDIITYQIGVLAKPLWDLDQHATQIVGRMISQNELVAKLIIKDYFGRVAFTYTNQNITGSINRSAPVRHNDDLVGDVFISLTSEYFERTNNNLITSFIITTFFILFTLVVFSGLLVRTFLRKPLNKLNNMVRAYAAGEYEAIDGYQPYIEFKPFTRVLHTMGKMIVRQLKDLVTAEEKYRSIYENAIEGMFQSSPEGRYISVNPAMAGLLGYSSPEELLASITDIGKQTYIPKEDRQRFNDQMARHGSVIDFETALRRKEGSMILVAISARVVRDQAGKILYYEGYLVDITRRKRAIEALHQTKEQLALLLESLPIIAFTSRVGGDFGITYVSNSIKEITGYTPDQFTGNAAFWAEHILAEDSQKILHEFPLLLDAGRYRCEYRFRAADGSYRWFDDTRRLVNSANGGNSRIVGTWRDITEEKRLRSEADYRLQQVVMADKLASLGEVVAGVAHEICNPNSFIAYNVPILEETWQIFSPILHDFAQQNPAWRYRSLPVEELCQDIEETIQHIKIGSDRINRIVSHLKDFVRTDENLPPRPVKINEVVESSFTLVKAQIRKSGATIEMSLSPDIPPVLGYFQKLEQILTNLVVNALHATSEKSSGKISFRTRYLAHHKAVILQIEDNGRGMERDTMERIFEPFFTLRRDCGGSGLGLSISYHLVQEHHGVLSVLSQPGRGSRFTLFLPISWNVKLDLRPAALCVHRDRDFTENLMAYFSETGDTFLYVLHDFSTCLNFLEQHPEIDILFADLQTLQGAEGRFLVDLGDLFPLLTVILYGVEGNSSRHEQQNVAQCDYFLHAPFEVLQLKKIIQKTSRQKL
jgi:PAS domain S-box-containing protein